MKQLHFLMMFIIILALAAHGQVGINADGSQPDPSAMLDVKSGVKGLLPPRVALTAINVANPVVSPAVGLHVYNTATAGTSPNNVIPGNYYWNGTRWIPVSPPQGANFGDMLYWNGTQYVQVPVGLPGQFLRLSPDFVPTWMGATFATLTTTAASGITASGAVSGGNITSDGGSNVTERGSCYNTSSSPTTHNTKVTAGFGTGSFTATLSQLAPNMTYYVRAYAFNSAGTAYGNEVSFSTLPASAIPVISGEASPCQDNNYSYSTEMYLPPYDWIVSGTAGVDYTITDGGGLTDHAISITWHTSGAQSVSVSYFGASGYGVLPVNVVETLPVSVVITASENPACAGTPVILTATPVNGGTTPFYQWQINGMAVAGGTNSSYTTYPSDWESISCTMSSSAPCAEPNPVLSNTIGMTVSDIYPAAVNIQTSANPICTGNPVTFTATPVFGGSTPQYQWTLNGISINGATGSTYTYMPSNQDAISCMMTSSLPCVPVNPVESEPIIMTVLPMSASVSIAASSNPSCQGELVTFTATPTNAGTSPSYQWTVDGFNVGSNVPTYSYIPSDGQTIQCMIQSSSGCGTPQTASSNTISMLVIPVVTAGVTISASANPVCLGSPVTFTAIAVNGGASPTYQWKLNGIMITGPTNQTFTYIPANNDVISCVMTSSLQCVSGNPASSNPITMYAGQNLPVSITIQASTNPICPGYAVTYSATPVNGGSAPLFQWMVNGIIVSGGNGSVFTYTPMNNDQVSCTLTSSQACVSGNPATSNIITMIVVPPPTSVTINASQNPFCNGSTVTCTSTAINGGMNPSYQWQVNGFNVSGATNSSYTFLPSNNDQVNCILTSSSSCVSGNPATSNTVVLNTGTNLPVSVTVSSNVNNVCPGTSVQFTATVTNGGNIPVYQWFKNSIFVGANLPYYNTACNNLDQITCRVTSSLSCANPTAVTSAPLIMNVLQQANVSVSIAASVNESCAGTAVTYTAVSVNPGSNPLYRWKLNGIIVSASASPVFTTIPSNGDLILCQLSSSELCANPNVVNSNTITAVVNSPVPVAVSISASANPVSTGASVTFTAISNNGGASPGYQWKKNGTSVGTNSSTFTYNPENNDIITCILTSSGTCVSGNPATSNPIVMSVTGGK